MVAEDINLVEVPDAVICTEVVDTAVVAVDTAAGEVGEEEDTDEEEAVVVVEVEATMGDKLEEMESHHEICR